MYKIQRAVIMAAGKGIRMLPVTSDIPKPLIKVNGVRMIETIITALKENDIQEIYIVVGYLKEKFEVLKGKYPDIQFVYNPDYDICNNISSLYAARNYIQDAFIVDGDQIIYNKKVLGRDFEKSGYNCVWQSEETQEWLLEVENGTVTKCSRTGGKNGWQLYGISRWAKNDAIKLKKHIEMEYMQRKNYQIYWDDVALFCYPKEYNLGIYEMNSGDVLEIDSIDELVKIDGSYKKYLR